MDIKITDTKQLHDIHLSYIEAGKHSGVSKAARAVLAAQEYTRLMLRYNKTRLLKQMSG